MANPPKKSAAPLTPPAEEVASAPLDPDGVLAESPPVPPVDPSPESEYGEWTPGIPPVSDAAASGFKPGGYIPAPGSGVIPPADSGVTTTAAQVGPNATGTTTGTVLPGNTTSPVLSGQLTPSPSPYKTAGAQKRALADQMADKDRQIETLTAERDAALQEAADWRGVAIGLRNEANRAVPLADPAAEGREITPTNPHVGMAAVYDPPPETVPAPAIRPLV